MKTECSLKPTRPPSARAAAVAAGDYAAVAEGGVLNEAIEQSAREARCVPILPDSRTRGREGCTVLFSAAVADGGVLNEAIERQAWAARSLTTQGSSSVQAFDSKRTRCPQRQAGSSGGGGGLCGAA